MTDVRKKRQNLSQPACSATSHKKSRISFKDFAQWSEQFLRFLPGGVSNFAIFKKNFLINSEKKFDLILKFQSLSMY